MEFRDIELVALRDVYLSKLRLAGVSKDYHLRKIFREYSKLFHTPLHEVHSLPLEFVLQAWLEEHYETYSMDDLRAEAKEHLQTKEELLALRAEEDAADADTWMIIQDEQRAMRDIKKLEDAVRATQTALQTFKPRDRDTELVSNTGQAPKEIPQGITMRWDPNLDTEDMDSFGIFDSPKQGK